MRYVDDFPHRIREIENTWIALSDGCRLAARIWLPDDAETHPVPAILEYVPYRKDDITARQDATRHPYFAGHGYAAVRVDLRGTGDSDGLLRDEYLAQEQDDALEVLAWLAEQPWCTGRVGMIGYSWGGFNGLQVAARRPPELGAVVSLYSTDDRYLDDCHYMGGVLLGSDMLKWASTLLSWVSLPPDPRFVPDWRKRWLERLDATPPFVEAWLAHQRKDEYWRHGSVSEDYSAIEAPTLVVGGWADGYTNAVPRLLQHLTCPRRGIIGPWAHVFPERGAPGPAIGFLQECVRWFDRWLKDVENGADAEPLLYAWMQRSIEPKESYVERPGRWVGETSWPPASVEPQTWSLGADEALTSPDEVAAGGEPLTILGSQLTGSTAGVWCPSGTGDELPIDQNTDDKRSLAFDSAPLASPLEVLGVPEAHLTVIADRADALVTVRLCDVAPNGFSTLVSWGQLNLTHRYGHARPTPCRPGEVCEVVVPLNVIGHVFEAGHQLRVAISPTYWPHAWPSPRPVTLQLLPAEKSTLVLPVRDPARGVDAGEPFGEPESARPPGPEPAGARSRTRRRHRNPVTRAHEIEDAEYRTTVIDPPGTLFTFSATDLYSIVEGEPLSARVECTRQVNLERGDWQVHVATASSLSCDAGHFHVINTVEAYDGDRVVFSRTRAHDVERDGM